MGFTDITYRSIGKPEVGVNGYTGFRPNEKVVLKKGSSLPGWSEGEQCLPLGCDILYERDIEIKVRDGARLYVDILRPAHATENVPCVISWSPYGAVLPLNLLGLLADLREQGRSIQRTIWCPFVHGSAASNRLIYQAAKNSR